MSWRRQRALDLVLGQRPSRHGAVQQGVDDVISAWLGLPPLHHPLNQAHEARVNEWGLGRSQGMHDGHGPVERLVYLGFGKPEEQPEDHRARQRAGEVGDELAAPLRNEGVDEVAW